MGPFQANLYIGRKHAKIGKTNNFPWWADGLYSPGLVSCAGVICTGAGSWVWLLEATCSGYTCPDGKELKTGVATRRNPSDDECCQECVQCQASPVNHPSFCSPMCCFFCCFLFFVFLNLLGGMCLIVVPFSLVFVWGVRPEIGTAIKMC